MQKVVLASGNAGKIKELSALLLQANMVVVSQSTLQVPEAEETGLSFVENAIIKARNAALHTGLPAIADDSGLEVDALNGAPGIYSARYAGAAATDADNNEKLLRELETIPEHNRTARFRCSLVYLRHVKDPSPLIAEGHWEGQVVSTSQGEQGFGYDPVFYLPDLQCTAAQLTRERKGQLSHRASALKALLIALGQRKRSG